jgi:hypothetical protein
MCIGAMQRAMAGIDMRCTTAAHSARPECAAVLHETAQKRLAAHSSWLTDHHAKQRFGVSLAVCDGGNARH